MLSKFFFFRNTTLMLYMILFISINLQYITKTYAENINSKKTKHVICYFCGGGTATRKACELDVIGIEDRIKQNYLKDRYNEDIDFSVKLFYPDIETVTPLAPYSHYSKKYRNETVFKKMKKITESPQNENATYHFLVNSLGYEPFKSIYTSGLHKLGIKKVGTIIFNQPAHSGLKIATNSNRNDKDVFYLDSKHKKTIFINLNSTSEKTNKKFGIIEFKVDYEKKNILTGEPKKDSSGNTIFKGEAYIPDNANDDHAVLVEIGLQKFGDLFWASLLNEKQKDNSDIDQVKDVMNIVIDRQNKIISSIIEKELPKKSKKKRKKRKELNDDIELNSESSGGGRRGGGGKDSAGNINEYFFHCTNSNTNKTTKNLGDIGGVLLQGIATTKEKASVYIAGGNFSFIVKGKNARLNPKTFRKFVTALWSTYFTCQDPGISIDPIAPGSKKHLVRYIGHVINNDLGRVMREADYLMKKMAVGTEKPDINKFMTPDDISAKKGVYNVGAWSRFWFIPENMSFKRGGNMLIFDKGRMRVKTEYLFLNNDNETKADSANSEFANFFTDNYNKISEKYPIYKELFQYAKLVSLTKYLKENNIPLLWFLMANKDLVITENSKSTVDALIKNSEHARGVCIEGGVELSSKAYIYDKLAIKAINDAIKNNQKNKKSETSLKNKKNVVKIGSGNFSFNLEKEDFSVIAQHTLTSGKDRRGIKYLTDLAIKASGFKLTRRSLEYLKSIIIKQRISDKLKKAIEANVMVDKDLAYIQIHKEIYNEVDEMITKLYKFINQNFETKSEFHNAIEFELGRKEAKKIKTLVTKHAYYKTNIELVRYVKHGNSEFSDFGKGCFLLTPYRIHSVGIKTVQFGKLILTHSMLIENLLSGHKEIMEYNNDQYDIPCYLPQDIKTSQNIGLFLTERGTFRLIDKIGNEFYFDDDGIITDMIFGDYYVIHYEYCDKFIDDFEKNPFQIEPADQLKTQYLNIEIPQKIIVKNLISESEELFSFRSKWGIGAYIPKSSDKYKKMILKPGVTFHIFDKHDNEIVFNNSGLFLGLKNNNKGKFIKSISMGGHKIYFTYCLLKNNTTAISHARLFSIEDHSESLHTVYYFYDKKGRLSKVKHSSEMNEAVFYKLNNEI